MTTNIFKSYNTPVIHGLSWLLLSFLFLFYIPLSWEMEVPLFFWMWHILVLVIMIIIFYTNALWIVPATIIREKTYLFILWIVLVVISTQIIAHFYAAYTGMHQKMGHILNLIVKKFHTQDNFIFALTLLVIGISTSWAMAQHWQQAARHKLQLEQDKVNAELNLLKSQINPHFFFNSLNSIYSLTYIDIEDSRGALHTLSRMMRYLLYNTDNEQTTLQKEIDFLKNYIKLMRLRANNKLTITTQFPETLHDYPMAPMLLLPFVENAFKHGIDPTVSSEIQILIAQNEAVLSLKVLNCIVAKDLRLQDEGGIGMVNTSRRLDLLYPDKYELKSGVNEKGKYEVNLQINLEQ